MSELGFRKKLFAEGHRGCAGCGAAIAARIVLEATGENVIVVTPTGCLEIISTPYPESAWRVPWIHSLFENAAAVASGIEAALKILKKDAKPVVIAGDGATADIGFGSLSGAFERGHNILYVCYDNEAYMNTGVQRSGCTPFAASTTTSPAGRICMGNPRPKKDLPMILAHHGAYVATASISYPKDAAEKIRKAMKFKGPSFIQIHAPCPTGWAFDSSKTIEIGRLAVLTGLWPLVEIENGKVVGVMKIVERLPVEEYLKPQRRFAHLFKSECGRDFISKLQQIADENVKKYGLEG